MFNASGRGDHRDPLDRSQAAPADAEALVASFRAWAADQRARDAAAARGRERWLRQQAAESATWLGALVDLAEARAEIVALIGDRSLTGRLVGVGEDVAILAEPLAGTAILALPHLRAVRLLTSPGTATPAGDRPPSLQLGLADALGSLAADRSPVRLVLAGGETLSGELIAVGVDVLTLQVPGTGGYAHVPLAAVQICAPTR